MIPHDPTRLSLLLEEPFDAGGDGGGRGGGGGAPRPMPPPGQTEKIELLQSALGIPIPLTYGRHIVGGNVLFQQENADESITIFIALGEGEWDAIEELWINGAKQTLPATARIHFHPGIDGQLGVESAPATPNQKICSFYPSAFSPQLTFSRMAYLALKIKRDPEAPGPGFDIRAIYRTMKVRSFDATGNQLSYAYSTNPAWCILDLLIRRFLKPHGTANQALTSSQKAKIDFQTFVDAASFCDSDPGDGAARFETHVAFVQQTDLLRALEQMLLLCRGYLLERNGKFALFIDQARASEFTAGRDAFAAGSLALPRKDLRSLANKINIHFRVLDSGGADPAKDFQPVTREFVDEDHQDQVGRIISAEIDLGNNTLGRATRLGDYLRRRTISLLRQLQLRLLPEAAQAASNPLDLLPGDRILGPKDVDGFETLDYEILEITDEPDGSRQLFAQEYDESIFVDTLAAETVIFPTDPDADPTITSPSVNPQTNILSWRWRGRALTFDVQIDDTGAADFGELVLDLQNIRDPFVTLRDTLAANPFEVRIRARNEKGAFAWAQFHWDGRTAADVVNPQVTEDGLVIDGHHFSNVTFSWQIPVDDQYAGVSILVRRTALGPGGQAQFPTDWTPLFTKRKPVISWKERLEKTGERVDFVFVSFDFDGWENRLIGSPIVTGIVLDGNDSAPNTPTGLVGRAVIGGRQLTWNENIEDDIEAYEVFAKPVGDLTGSPPAGFSLIQTVPASFGAQGGTVTWTDEAEGDEERRYAIRANDKGGSRSGFTSAINVRSLFDIPKSDNLLPNGDLQDFPSGETVARQWQATGTAAFARDTDPSEGRVAQKITCSSVQTGLLESRKVPALANLFYLTGQSINSNVALTTGSRFLIRFYNAAGTLLGVADTTSRAALAGNDELNFFFRMPKSGDGTVRSAIDDIAILPDIDGSPTTLSADPKLASVQTGLKLPNVNNVRKYSRVSLSLAKRPSTHVPFGSPATNNATFTVTNSVISWGAFTIFMGGTQGQQISVGAGSITGLTVGETFVLFYDHATAIVKQSTTLTGIQDDENTMLGVATTKLNTPATPTLIAVAQTNAIDTQYFVKTQYVKNISRDVAGDLSAEATVNPLVDQSVQVASPGASTNATHYDVYLAESTGAEVLVTRFPVALGTNFTYTARGVTLPDAPPDQPPDGDPLAPPGGSGGGGDDGIGGGTDAERCPMDGTEIAPLCGHPSVSLLDESEWIEIVLADGTRLTATPNHPVYTDRGKTELQNLTEGEKVVTIRGMVSVSAKHRFRRKAKKMAISVPGELFWANGILSHNKLARSPTLF